MNQAQTAEPRARDDAAPSPAANPEAPSDVTDASSDAVERARALTRKAGTLATRAAERVPAAVVVVVGGGVLLAADAFGIGEVITAGVAGYAAYRMLRRRARARQRAAESEAQP